MPARSPGAGSIAGNLTLSSNAALAPGSGGIGTFTIGGNTTWNGSTTGASTALFDLSNVNTTSDRAAIAGPSLKGGAAFQFDFQGSGTPGTYTLMTFSSTTFNAADFSSANLGPGLTGVFSIAGGTALQFAVVALTPTSFLVSAPASATAGTAFNFTVTGWINSATRSPGTAAPCTSRAPTGRRSFPPTRR